MNKPKKAYLTQAIARPVEDAMHCKFVITTGHPRPLRLLAASLVITAQL